MSLVLVVQGRNTKNAVGENNELEVQQMEKNENIQKLHMIIYTTEDGLAKQLMNIENTKQRLLVK